MLSDSYFYCFVKHFHIHTIYFEFYSACLHVNALGHTSTDAMLSVEGGCSAFFRVTYCRHSQRGIGSALPYQ